MAYVTPVAWRIDYGNELLRTVAQRLVFVQSFTSDFSTAAHTFSVTPGSEGVTVQSDVQAEIEKGKIEFSLEDISKSQRTITHKHLVFKYDMGVALATDKAERNSCTVVSVERRMLMHMNEKTIARRGASADAIVQQIVGEYGDLSLDAAQVERAPLPDEFQSLIQPDMTDHAFIVRHLIPRSWNGKSGGYNLYSSDGATLGFSTMLYNRREAVLVPEEILSVDEGSNPFSAILEGGATLAHEGFDPLRKKPIFKTVDDFPERIASGQPFHTGGRTLWHPTRTPAANEVWGRAFHDARCWSSAFDVKIRGRAKLGENGDVDIKPNLVVDLSKTKYRDRGAVRGLVRAVTHEWRDQTYNMILHCVRNASDI